MRPVSERALSYPAGSLAQAAALVLLAGSAFALAAAWYFQLVVGLAPCPLCLDQRLAYYFAIPVGLATLLAARAGRPGLARALLAVLGLAMLANMGLAMYHAGVEWAFWPGPAACTGAPVLTGDILSALKGARVPRCDEAAWRLLGLSMAGWNALIAAALAAVGLGGAALEPAPISLHRKRIG
ncbi:disulfide bond formation protein B [Xanthobacter sp. AM11]|uniref:disulfide bond formation protein B n=1 Tax=Xanthobacter sp. AM11 TaxID=3380643 RepID=UPI0039BF4334